MNLPYMHVQGGPRAWNVFVGGKECWIGRSKSGYLLGRLFGSENEALSAGDALEKHFAQIEDSLRADRWKAIVLELDADGEVIVFWDVENEKPDATAHHYNPEDANVMQAIQEALDLLENPVVEDQSTPNNP